MEVSNKKTRKDLTENINIENTTTKVNITSVVEPATLSLISLEVAALVYTTTDLTLASGKGKSLMILLVFNVWSNSSINH